MNTTQTQAILNCPYKNFTLKQSLLYLQSDFNWLICDAVSSRDSSQTTSIHFGFKLYNQVYN